MLFKNKTLALSISTTLLYWIVSIASFLEVLNGVFFDLMSTPLNYFFLIGFYEGDDIAYISLIIAVTGSWILIHFVFCRLTLLYKKDKAKQTS